MNQTKGRVKGDGKNRMEIVDFRQEIREKEEREKERLNRNAKRKEWKKDTSQNGRGTEGEGKSTMQTVDLQETRKIERERAVEQECRRNSRLSEKKGKDEMNQNGGGTEGDGKTTQNGDNALRKKGERKRVESNAVGTRG